MPTLEIINPTEGSRGSRSGMRPRARSAGTQSAPSFKGSLVRYTDSKPHRRRTHATDTYSSGAVLCGLPEVRGPGLYRACVIEFVGTCLFLFIHIAIVQAATAQVPNAKGVMEPAFSYPPVPIAIGHAIVAALFIFSAAAGSGGHLVNTISVATAFTGHTSWIRCGLYVVVQTLGAILGAVLMRASMGWDTATPARMAMCSLGSLPLFGAFISEFMWTFALLFVAYGVAFDPKNGQVFGPIMAPIFVGIMLGTNLFASSGISTIPGYAPGMTWHICLAPAIAMGEVPSSIWIYFIAPVMAAAVHAALFYGAPPHHEEFGCFTPPLLHRSDEEDE